MGKMAHWELKELYNEYIRQSKKIKVKGEPLKELAYHAFYRRHRERGHSINDIIFSLIERMKRKKVLARYSYNYGSTDINSFIKDPEQFRKDVEKAGNYASLPHSYPDNMVTKYAYYLVKTEGNKYTYPHYRKLILWGYTVEQTVWLNSQREKGQNTLKDWYKEVYLKERKHKEEEPYAYESMLSVIYEGGEKEELLTRSKKEEKKKASQNARKSLEQKLPFKREVKAIIHWLKEGMKINHIHKDYWYSLHQIKLVKNNLKEIKTIYNII